MANDVEIYERLTALETLAKGATETLSEHVKDDREYQEKVLTGLSEINAALHRQKGFLAGAVFVIVAIAGAAELAWKFFHG